MNKTPDINDTNEVEIPSFDDLQPLFDDQSRRIDTALQTKAARHNHMRPLWRYAAAAVTLVAVGLGIFLLHSPSSTPQNNLVASNNTSQRHYAYSESTSGIRVYCENGCNADDVMQQMMAALQTLD